MNCYDLNNPVKIFKLPKDLDEISGLVYHKDQTLLELLLILSAKGRITNVNRLNPERFEQPEGIAFDENQNLYISNERVRHSANILKFSPLEEFS